MYRNFNAVVGRPFRVALLRVQTAARLKPCPTYKKKAAEGLIIGSAGVSPAVFLCRRDACATVVAGTDKQGLSVHLIIAFF